MEWCVQLINRNNGDLRLHRCLCGTFITKVTWICVRMESLIEGKTTVNMGKTIEKHANIITERLSVHYLTSCDTMVCCYTFTVGKWIPLKALRAWLHSLAQLRLVDAPMKRSSNGPMRSCYNVMDAVQENSMSEARFRMWAFQTGDAISSATIKLVLFEQIKHLCRT
jgi:hypothetical protein